MWYAHLLEPVEAYCALTFKKERGEKGEIDNMKVNSLLWSEAFRLVNCAELLLNYNTSHLNQTTTNTPPHKEQGQFPCLNKPSFFWVLLLLSQQATCSSHPVVWLLAGSQVHFFYFNFYKNNLLKHIIYTIKTTFKTM